MSNICPRVRIRMACPECRYPFSEALYRLDKTVSHANPGIIRNLLDTMIDELGEGGMDVSYSGQNYPEALDRCVRQIMKVCELVEFC